MLEERMDSPVILLLFGLLVLAMSGEGLLRGAVTVAKELRVPPLLIGLTIIAFGTSAPELTVSINAALEGNPDIAIGNVVGSNIANILLVLGAMAATRSFVVHDTTLTRDGWVMLAVSLVFVGLAMYGEIARPVGIILLAALVGYTIYLYHATRTNYDAEEAAAGMEENTVPGGLLVGLGVLGAGLLGVIWGADLMVNGAVGLARQFGLSEAVIALSIVAIGTSLPELAVSMVATFRGHAGLALGNIIGSNISNILLVLGATAGVTSLPITAEIIDRDSWVMLAVALLGVYFMTSGRVMRRREGAACLVLYAAYMGWLYY